jgi:Carbohydrate-selective porin, OprB family
LPLGLKCRIFYERRNQSTESLVKNLEGSSVILMVSGAVRCVSAPLQLAGVVQDRNNSLHVEGFYEYKLNDHMAITPGIIWLTAPGHNKNNDAAVIGTIRTTLTF